MIEAAAVILGLGFLAWVCYVQSSPEEVEDVRDPGEATVPSE